MKVNHGPCAACGSPILYLGCRYCGPRCNFSDLSPRPHGMTAGTEEGGPEGGDGSRHGDDTGEGGSSERPVSEGWLDWATRDRLYG